VESRSERGGQFKIGTMCETVRFLAGTEIVGELCIDEKTFPPK